MAPLPVVEMDDSQDVFEVLRETPGVFTARRNGEEDVVVMTGTAFRQMQDDAYDDYVAASIQKGLDEISRGEGVEAHEVSRMLREEYGLL